MMPSSSVLAVHAPCLLPFFAGSMKKFPPPTGRGGDLLLISHPNDPPERLRGMVFFFVFDHQRLWGAALTSASQTSPLSFFPSFLRAMLKVASLFLLENLGLI